MFKHLTANSAIVLAFVVAFEIVIMISPFAAFFYSVFNPVLLALNQTPITRWLTAFFLPHMIVPPDDFLKAIRIAGSWFFLLGLAIFFICAFQVYLGKLLKKGPAVRGLYRIIRHPQYAGLALAALGLAIMWPRFLTLALLGVMLFLYYILARDEERRMTNRFGEGYKSYMERTGMFWLRFRKGNERVEPPPSLVREVDGAGCDHRVPEVTCVGNRAVTLVAPVQLACRRTDILGGPPRDNDPRPLREEELRDRTTDPA